MKIFGKIRDFGNRLFGKVRVAVPNLFNKVQNGLNSAIGVAKNVEDIGKKVIDSGLVPSQLLNNPVVDAIKNNSGSNFLEKAKGITDIASNYAQAHFI